MCVRECVCVNGCDAYSDHIAIDGSTSYFAEA